MPSDPLEDSPLAQQIAAQVDPDPPTRHERHPKLFTDLDEDGLGEALFWLWQTGIIEADWDADAEATEWWMSEFGMALDAKGLTKPYRKALEDGSDFEAPTVVDPMQGCEQ